jgi:hypothetical protein
MYRRLSDHSSFCSSIMAPTSRVWDGWMLTMQHVPHKGSGPAIADVAAGQVKVLFDTLPSGLPMIRGGTCTRWQSPAPADRRLRKTFRRSPRPASLATKP